MSNQMQYLITICLIVLFLYGCSINQIKPDETKQDSVQFHASLINVEEELPIVVIHHTTLDDVDGFATNKEFNGSFLPTAHQVIAADKVLANHLKREKPGMSYFRQYGGFTVDAVHYLWVQLTAKQFVLKNETLELWDLSSYFNGYLKVWDGGDYFGKAVIELETGKVVLIQFNGNV